MPIQYIIEPPDEADQPEAGWPLIIFLHGACGLPSAGAATTNQLEILQ